MRALILILLLMASGCAETRVHRSSDETPSGSVVTLEKYSILFGLHTLGSPVNLSYYCPTGWSRLTTRKTTPQSVFTVLTLNLFSPWTVELECQPGA